MVKSTSMGVEPAYLNSALVDEHDINFIVMGAHGRTGLNHFLIGSVAEKVIRSATVPVHVVRIKTDSNRTESDESSR